MKAGPRNSENEPPETPWKPFWEQGPEMFKMNLQRPPGSHFRSRPKKCSKWASRSLLEAILGARSKNIQNEPPEASWEPFRSRPKKCSNEPPETSSFWKQCQKCSNELLKPSCEVLEKNARFRTHSKCSVPILPFQIVQVLSCLGMRPHISNSNSLWVLVKYSIFDASYLPEIPKTLLTGCKTMC